MSPTLPRVARVTIALAALILAVPVRSQDASTGAIRGVVLDPENRPVSAATVAIVSASTGAPRWFRPA